MKKQLLFITLIITLITLLPACSATKRANRLMHRAIALDPSLVQNQTITFTDTVAFYVPQYNLVDSIVPRYDTIPIITQITQAHNISAATAQQLRRAIIADYQKQLEADTLTIDTLQISAIAYYQNGKPHLQLTQNLDTLKQPHTITITQPQVVVQPKKHFTGFWGILKALGLILVGAVIIIIAIRKALGKMP